MVVPSGLADSLNTPSIKGVMGATGLMPHNGAGEAAAAGGEKPAAEPAAAAGVQPRP
jgi:hypothetical protein